MASAEDATIGGASSNVYALSAAADTYFGDRLNATGWTGASATDKTIALLQATRWLDTAEFQGIKVAQGQALKWPRYRATDDDGYEYDSSEIPTIVINAMYELALRLLNDGSTDTTADTGLEEFKKAKIGPMEVERYLGFRAGQFPQYIKSMLAPVMIASGGSVLMRRA